MLECSTDSRLAGSIVTSLWRVLNAPDVTVRHGIKSRLFRAQGPLTASTPAFSDWLFRPQTVRSRVRPAICDRPPVTDRHHLTAPWVFMRFDTRPATKVPGQPAPTKIQMQASGTDLPQLPPPGRHPVPAGPHRVGADFAVRPERFSPPTRFSPPVRVVASAGTAAGCRCARYRFHHSRMGLAMAIEE
jgi:hypothetical protein